MARCVIEVFRRGFWGGSVSLPAQGAGQVGFSLIKVFKQVGYIVELLVEFGALSLNGINELFELVDIGFTGFIHIDNVTGVVQRKSEPFAAQN